MPSISSWCVAMSADVAVTMQIFRRGTVSFQRLIHETPVAVELSAEVKKRPKWIKHYITVRPHQALRYLTPAAAWLTRWNPRYGFGKGGVSGK